MRQSVQARPPRLWLRHNLNDDTDAHQELVGDRGRIERVKVTARALKRYGLQTAISPAPAELLGTHPFRITIRMEHALAPLVVAGVALERVRGRLKAVSSITADVAEATDTRETRGARRTKHWKLKRRRLRHFFLRASWGYSQDYGLY